MLQGQLHNENDEDLDEEDEDEDEDHAMELDSDMVRFFLVSNNLYSYIQYWKICKQCKANFKLHAILFCRIVMMRKKTGDLRYSDEKKKKKEEMNRTNIAVDLEVNQIERTKKTI